MMIAESARKMPTDCAHIVADECMQVVRFLLEEGYRYNGENTPEDS
jgi:hypothetical protein